ncbi:GNAT family N-acetyltransferase [Vibrio mimicus]|uniref:GNAT family N-acetyltransferase n=1 Tax=Vibrio mimicus TaxID=674 RepID=UPI002FF37C30
MLKWLKSVLSSLRKHKLNRVQFELATNDDFECIFNQIIQSAKEGHFNPILVMPAAHEGLKYQLQTTINEGWCYVNQYEKKQSHIFVKRSVDGQLVGFSWVTKAENEYELYLLAVDKQHRRQGIASGLLCDFLKFVAIGDVVYARLYSVSTVMKNILIENGFNITQSKAKDTIRLEFTKC